MKDTEYTFAVARIRANETHLIGKNEMEQLLLAPDLRAALQLLADQGWETQGALEDPNEMLREQAARMWSLLTEVAPDVGELSFLTAKNDFHNLKAALKSLVSDQSPEPYWMHPNSVPVKLIWEAVSNRSFSRLPTRMQQPGRLAYELLVRASDGQRADALLDRAALETAKGRAEETGSKFAIRLPHVRNFRFEDCTACRSHRAGRTLFAGCPLRMRNTAQICFDRGRWARCAGADAVSFRNRLCGVRARVCKKLRIV